MEENTLYELMGLEGPASSDAGTQAPQPEASAEPWTEADGLEGHPLYQIWLQRRQTAEKQAKEWYAEQMRQICALDPELRTLEDLAARHPEEMQILLNAVRAGIPLAVAYKGLFFETLSDRRASAARKAGAVQAAGKEHLLPAGGAGKAAVSVPESVRTMYRDLMPGLTEREIQAAYEKFAKEAR